MCCFSLVRKTFLLTGWLSWCLLDTTCFCSNFAIGSFSIVEIGSFLLFCLNCAIFRIRFQSHGVPRMCFPLVRKNVSSDWVAFLVSAWHAINVWLWHLGEGEFRVHLLLLVWCTKRNQIFSTFSTAWNCLALSSKIHYCQAWTACQWHSGEFTVLLHQTQYGRERRAFHRGKTDCKYKCLRLIRMACFGIPHNSNRTAKN